MPPPAPSLSPATAWGSAPSQNSARHVTKTPKNPTLKNPKLQRRPEKGRKEFHSSNRDGKQRSGACAAGGKFHLRGRSWWLRAHPRLSHPGNASAPQLRPPSSEDPLPAHLPPCQQLHSDSTAAPPTPPTWPPPRPFLGARPPSTRPPSKGRREGQNTPARATCTPQGRLQGKGEELFGCWGEAGLCSPTSPQRGFASSLNTIHSCGADGQPCPCTPGWAAGGRGLQPHTPGQGPEPPCSATDLRRDLE